MGLVPAGQIKRMPGIKTHASEKMVKKAREFASRRGYHMPVILSDDDGLMTLLAGAATFKACLEEKRTKIPAVIVRTEGDADNLMFALQSSGLSESPDAISVSAAIVRLIDIYGISRKHIAESLNRSPAWVNRMEGLSRRLNETVQTLVVEGHISSRSAQEIARLPDDAQTIFAIAAGNEFLSKDSVAYLVNRYLNEDTGDEERSRIIHTPRLALPNELKARRVRIKDRSDSARLSRSMARLIDEAVFLSGLLDRYDADEAIIRISDATALAEILTALILKMQAVLSPGGKDAQMKPSNWNAMNSGGGAVD